jgi:hypothetical protein
MAGSKNHARPSLSTALMSFSSALQLLLLLGRDHCVHGFSHIAIIEVNDRVPCRTTASLSAPD